jgi:DNA-binding transcriptional LysR family regulator
MELRDIEYFAVVAEHGHLRRAAPLGVELTIEGDALLARVRGLRTSLADVARED